MVKHPPPVIGTLVAALRSEWWIRSSEVTLQQKRTDFRIHNLSGPHWTQSTFQRVRKASECLCFFASILYSTLVFFMELKNGHKVRCRITQYKVLKIPLIRPCKSLYSYIMSITIIIIQIMTQWMEIGQDEKALTGEDHGLQGRSPWKCPEILLLHLAV